MAKKMIIKGVGTFMAKRASKDGKGIEVITLGTLQNLKIDMNVELEDVFGGDGLFAIDTLVKSKSIEISATDAKFDLDAMQLMLGSRVQEGINDYVWVLGEQSTIAAATVNGKPGAQVIPEYGGKLTNTEDPNTIYDEGNFTVRLKSSNKVMTRISNAANLKYTSEYVYDVNNGRLIFHPSMVGQDVVFSYQRKQKVDVVDIIADEVPFPVHVIHHGSFLQKDGTYAGIETEIYQARAKGQLSIDAQRTAATAASIQLQVLDPERADGKIGSVKRYSSPSRS